MARRGSSPQPRLRSVRRRGTIRSRFAAARPIFLVLMTIVLLAGSAALFGWGGDEDYRTWQYHDHVTGTVRDLGVAGGVAHRVDGVSVSVPRFGSDPVYADFSTSPAVGDTVHLRCTSGGTDRQCVGEDLYGDYRSSEIEDAVLPAIALVGLLVVLISCGVSIVRWAGVYRRDRTEGVRELRSGVLTFVVGVAITLAWFYLALLRATA